MSSFILSKEKKTDYLMDDPTNCETNLISYNHKDLSFLEIFHLYNEIDINLNIGCFKENFPENGWT